MSLPRTGNRNSISIRSLGPSHRTKRAKSSVLSTDLLCIPTLPAWAKSTRNPQLQQDLERYLKLSNGASRILSIAQNPLQCLDAAKTLFVSNVQLLSCLRQVQREKMEDAARSSGSTEPIPPDVGPGEVDQQLANSCSGRAKICLSGKDVLVISWVLSVVCHAMQRTSAVLLLLTHSGHFVISGNPIMKLRSPTGYLLF
ncbi:hypothetical protein PHET_10227 [Paragonimus heterotremus]|uniref:Uncharacterized protein n=1 Tax=Paragonimus heterotremus TaxID=100268 RepID=A0A8J4T2A2_9TREM|nr:hypothetical protein PHET_10227 [Paragonimus heterotremus]